MEDAKVQAREGDITLRETIYAKRPTTTYEPQPWEIESADSRLEWYQQIEAIGQIRSVSRDRLVQLILSMESILRRDGYIAFPARQTYWSERISHRLPSRILDCLQGLNYLSPRPVQVGKIPNVFDASQEYLRLLPELPESSSEGSLISDTPWEPIEIRPADTPSERRSVLGPESPEEDTDCKRQEMIELNEWYADNADRIEGVDDLRFHRVFQHSLNWGGRLYGQFTGMQSAERDHIFIDGEDTLEADLNGSLLSFYLLISGYEAIPDDPYQHDQLANYERDFVKAVLLRLFGNGKWWTRRLPQPIHDNKASFGYPNGLPNYREFRQAVVGTYPILDRLDQFKPSWKIEMFESEALLLVLRSLRDDGEIGLPIHDGIRVRAGIHDETLRRFNEARVRVCQPEYFPYTKRRFTYF